MTFACLHNVRINDRINIALWECPSGNAMTPPQSSRQGTLVR
jgi:hypothetical protein